MINISLFRDTYSYNPGQEVVEQSLAELRVIAEWEDGQDECPARMRGSALNPLRRAERKSVMNLPGKANLSPAPGRHIRHGRGSPGTPMQGRPPRRAIDRRETLPGEAAALPPLPRDRPSASARQQPGIEWAIAPISSHPSRERDAQPASRNRDRNSITLPR